MKLKDLLHRKKEQTPPPETAPAGRTRPGKEERIFVTLDYANYLGRRITIEGWACDVKAEGESLVLRDADGADLPCEITRRVRDDVNGVMSVRAGRMSGFIAKFVVPEDANLPYYLEAENEEAHGCLPLDLELDQHARIVNWLEKKRSDPKNPAILPLEYDDWAAWHDLTEEQKEAQRRIAAEMTAERQGGAPAFSFCIPLYRTPERYLREIIDSVLAQTYGDFEICLADGSDDDAVERYLAEHYAGESRIRYRHLTENAGIAGNTNAAIAMAEGSYIIFSDHDDRVAPDACFELARAIAEDPENTDLLYSDEDKITEDGVIRYDPFFKPDFDRDLLRSYNYFTHIVCVRTSLAKEIGLRPGFEGAQDYDFVLRCAERARRIRHIPKILYHWRANELSTAGNPESKLYAYEHGKQAIEEHFRRTGVAGSAELTPYWGRYRCRYETAPDAVISTVTVKRNESPASVNRRAREAGGDLLLFLAEGAEGMTEENARDLAGFLARPEVGCVGTRILDENDLLYHAGYWVGCEGPVPYFEQFHRVIFTYAGLANLTHEVRAAGCECMMVRKADFLELGGFDESFSVSDYDLDLCMRLAGKGLLTVLHPAAEIRVPSAFRSDEGFEKKRERDRRRFLEKWEKACADGDPYFNPNLEIHRRDITWKWELD